MIHRFVATIAEKQYEVTVEPVAEGGAPGAGGGAGGGAGDDRWRVTIDGRSRVVEARRVEGTVWSLLPPGGGAARLVDVDGRAPDFSVTADGATVPLKLVEGRRALAAAVGARAAAQGPLPVRAPMPGKVVKVLVKPGEAVKAQQGVVVIEAMKMENELRAPRDGTVAEIAVKEGQAVEAGQALVTIA